MIIDHTQDKDPVLIVYFVYDDILVHVDGHLEVVESILPHLSFYEADLSTTT